MFSGIIESIGLLRQISKSSDGVEVRIGTGSLNPDEMQIGDSIGVSGICLTITEFEDDDVKVFVSNETLACTQFGSYREGTQVNLERPLRLNQGLGGHFVAGHVDGIGRCIQLIRDGASLRIEVEVSHTLGRYIAPKGSITLDGVSLTINSVTDEKESTIFTVNLIPHTLKVTTLGQLLVGDQLNIEVDLIARYVDRLTQFS